MSSKKTLITAKPPEVADGCAIFIDLTLTKKSLVLETGCGDSTLWLAERALLVAAVYHDRVRVDTVNGAFEKAGMKNALVVYQRNYPEIGPRIIGDIEFDMIIVGGLGRVKTILTMWHRLKPGGYLVLDNSQCDLYKGARWHLDSMGWPCVAWFEAQRCTRMWRRPAATLEPETNDLIH